MKDVGAIIKSAREAKRWTQEQMADKMGISLRQYNKYEGGKFPKYKSSVAEEIDSLLGTKIKELIYEQNVPREKQGNVSYSKELDGTIQTWEEGTTFYGLKDRGDYLNKRRALKNATTIHTAPLVHAKARAGYVKRYHDNEFIDTLERYGLPPGVSPIGAIWRWFEVEGDSMETNIYSGDIVLCSQVPQEDWINIRLFHTYFVITDNDVYIKRLYPESHSVWILISDNEAHPPQRIDVSEVKELWVFRRHIKKAVPMNRKFDIEKIIAQLNKDKKSKSKT